MRRDLESFVIETFPLIIADFRKYTCRVGITILVLISMRTNDVEVQRSRHNYSTPILTDLVRIDDIIINCVYV